MYNVFPLAIKFIYIFSLKDVPPPRTTEKKGFFFALNEFQNRTQFSNYSTNVLTALLQSAKLYNNKRVSQSNGIGENNTMLYKQLLGVV